MNKLAIILPVLFLFWIGTAISADPPSAVEANCPADQAADQGIKILGQLHEIMAPAWHEAYPAHNYVALGEAIVKFDSMTPTLEGMTPVFKIDQRREKFQAARTRFIDLVNQGKSASEAGDNDALEAIYPDLHKNFEEMAYYLLPLQYPEYKSLRVVVDLMIDTHLKNGDYKAIGSSVEALKIKNDQLQKAPLPEDLTAVAEQVKADLGAIDAQCRELEAACGSTSAKNIEDSLRKLKITCDTFEQDYI
jgi:cytochrome c556